MKIVFVNFARTSSTGSAKVIRFGALATKPSSINYLRVLLDTRLRFMDHIATVSKKFKKLRS